MFKSLKKLLVAFSLLGLSFTPSTLLLAPSAQAETDKTGVSEVVYEKTSNQDGEIPLQIINVSFDGEGNISNVAIQTPSPNSNFAISLPRATELPINMVNMEA